jgi:hypothetical protein
MVESRKVMPKIVIDGMEYNTEDLTDIGKEQLAALQFVEVQLRKLRSEIAVYQTAQRTYIAALKSEIGKADNRSPVVDPPTKQ